MWGWKGWNPINCFPLKHVRAFPTLCPALCWLHRSEVYKPEPRLSKSLSWLMMRAYIFRRLRIFDWDFFVTTCTKTLGTMMDQTWYTQLSSASIYVKSDLSIHFIFIITGWNRWVNKWAFLVFASNRRCDIIFLCNRTWPAFTIKLQVVNNVGLVGQGVSLRLLRPPSLTGKHPRTARAWLYLCITLTTKNRQQIPVEALISRICEESTKSSNKKISPTEMEKIIQIGISPKIHKRLANTWKKKMFSLSV